MSSVFRYARASAARLVAAGACHGSAFGWERPNWYAPAGVEPKYIYSYGRQNWFDYSAAEHHAVRDNVGFFDQSHFTKRFHRFTGMTPLAYRKRFR